jgi:UDP-N-acetylmuramoyl-L-alanyl-D-glutamate--2,6-diaminopimelate ligase
MIDAGNRSCVMEVSSHALALRRVDGMTFAAAIFTNLTRDHLDFHADMEDYFQAKRRLFQLLPRDHPAVINADDPRARRSSPPAPVR